MTEQEIEVILRRLDKLAPLAAENR